VYFFFNESNETQTRTVTLPGLCQVQTWDATSGTIQPLDGVTQVLVGWSAIGDRGTMPPPKGVTKEASHVLVPLTLTNYEARIIVLKKF
jgi:hypothetical protein